MPAVAPVAPEFCLWTFVKVLGLIRRFYFLQVFNFIFLLFCLMRDFALLPRLASNCRLLWSSHFQSSWDHRQEPPTWLAPSFYVHCSESRQKSCLNFWKLEITVMINSQYILIYNSTFDYFINSQMLHLSRTKEANSIPHSFSCLQKDRETGRGRQGRGAGCSGWVRAGVWWRTGVVICSFECLTRFSRWKHHVVTANPPTLPAHINLSTYFQWLPLGGSESLLW